MPNRSACLILIIALVVSLGLALGYARDMAGKYRRASAAWREGDCRIEPFNDGVEIRWAMTCRQFDPGFKP